MIDLIHGDCMDLMKGAKDKQWDLAIVDPPYGIGINSMNYTTSGAIRTRGNAAATRRDYRKKSLWDVAPNGDYFQELFRISKEQIIWGGNYFTDFLPKSKSWLVWDKRCSNEMVNDFSDCELAWACRGVARIFRFQWNGMIQGNMKDKEDRFHPTQKPVALYKWLLKNYAKPGDKILDTHLGSGSIAIACHDYGFDLTGTEIDSDYFNAALKRLRQHQAQTKLFPVNG